MAVGQVPPVCHTIVLVFQYSLISAYHSKQLADGVIILYPINLPRLSESCMSYSSLRFGLMEVLDIGVESGSDFNRVVFTTTMWDESSTSPETVIEYLQTEENLRREWLPLIKRGADLRIGTNTVEFAQMVIYDLLKVHLDHKQLCRR